jgi:hypothetical protein
VPPRPAEHPAMPGDHRTLGRGRESIAAWIKRRRGGRRVTVPGHQLRRPRQELDDLGLPGWRRCGVVSLATRAAGLAGSEVCVGQHHPAAIEAVERTEEVV